MVKVSKVSFEGWKNCLSIVSGGVEAIVTTECGPRIISYRYCGGENHMAVFAESKGKTGQTEWTSYGGHRLWVAPEVKPRSYDVDTSKVEYEILDDGATFMTTDILSNVVKRMTITFVGEEMHINHELINLNNWEIELSLWPITVFHNGGLLVAPTTCRDTGLTSNRAISLWPYSRMNDPRVYWGDKYITVTPSNDAKPFKFGATIEDGQVMYFNFNQLVIKEFDFYFGDYPNYNCNFESYTNAEMIEIESLSPLMTVEPRESVCHEEIWRVFDKVEKPAGDDEKQIEKLLKGRLKEKS